MDEETEWVFPTDKLCVSCRERKSLDSFSLNDATIDGYSSTCRECAKIRLEERKRADYVPKKVVNRFTDLTGKVFGEYTVVRRVRNKCNRPYWHCKCSCGIEKEINGEQLRNGEVKSCGARGHRIANLLGKRYASLVVISKAVDKDSDTWWLCKCDCGEFTKVRAHHLNSKNVKSCGCLRRDKLIDITGKRFGQLVVLRKEENQRRKNSWSTRTIWRCLCDCGKEFLAEGENLKSGCYVSCGHMRDLYARVSLLDYQTKRKISAAARAARFIGSVVEEVDPFIVWERDGRKCLIGFCGGINLTFAKMTLDHIIPLSKGGLHSYNNTQAACSSCNCKKNDSIIEHEWLLP